MGGVKVPFLSFCYAKDIFGSLIAGGVGMEECKWWLTNAVGIKKKN